MGVDNVPGVAGAAQGAFDLVIIGLLISVPIVVFGSTVMLKLVDRFPAIIQIGSAVLAFTAAKMVVSEPLLAGVFGGKVQPAEWLHTAARWSTYALAVVGVLAAGWWSSRKALQANLAADAQPKCGPKGATLKFRPPDRTLAARPDTRPYTAPA